MNPDRGPAPTESEPADTGEPACSSELADEILPEPPPTVGEGNRQVSVLLMLLFEAGLIPLALGVGWLCGVWPLATLHFTWDAAAWGVAATLPLLAGLVVIDRHPVGPLVELRRVVDEWVLPLFRGLRVWQLAAISLSAGIGEELLFRGLLQGGMAVALGHVLRSGPASVAALVIASALFGLLHLISKTYAALCFVVGLYLGAVWLSTGNLLVPMVSHGLYDFVALLYLLRRVPRAA